MSMRLTIPEGTGKIKITEVGVWTKGGWKSQKLDIPLFANSYREKIANKLLSLIWHLYLSE